VLSFARLTQHCLCKQTFFASICGSRTTTTANHTYRHWLELLACFCEIDSNMACTSGDALMQSLERERLAIWSSHPTDEARQAVWSQRRAQLISYLFNDASAPRSIQQELAQARHPAAGHSVGV
jgi:hypothetical protein